MCLMSSTWCRSTISSEVFEFTNDALEALKHEIAAEMGFDLVDHTLELYGRRKRN